MSRMANDNGGFHADNRLRFLYIFVIAVFILLIGRLFILQVVKGADYYASSESNKYRVISIPARRGNIYDTNNKVLASSESYMNVQVYLEEVEDKQALATALADLFEREDIVAAVAAAKVAIAENSLDEKIQSIVNPEGAAVPADTEDEEEEEVDETLTAAEILEMMESVSRIYEPVTIATYDYSVGIQLAQIIAENKTIYPGVSIEETPVRTYPNGYILGHVLGTVGKISESEYESLQADGYRLDDIIGKSGLEKQYETYVEGDTVIGLKGTWGKEELEVDAKNQTISTLSEEAPEPGDSLVLTIDIDVQTAMEKSLAKMVQYAHDTYNSKADAGSAVLIDVDTGAIIAMASYPSLDPNSFAEGLTTDESQYYNDEDLRPQVNRAISSGYAPGSTFKLVTATAILMAGIDPYATVNCTPSVWVDPLARCWKSEGHGYVNFYEATAGSCNTYYQIMGNKAGIDNILSAGRAYGFGQLTGIDLPGEIKGLLPSVEWKRESFEDWETDWHTYDTYYTSIGQGYNVDTVLQLASYTAAVANGGVRMQPYICQEIVSDEGVLLKEFTPTEVADVGLTEEQAAILVNAMKAVTSDGGTAAKLFDSMPDNLRPAAKTGTAQTGLVGDDSNKDYHGVFIAFAPADDPQVAFACLIEYGTKGGSTAGVVALDTFNAYFGLEGDNTVNVSTDE